MKVDGKKDSILEIARAGTKGQVHNEQVTHVLLTDGTWYEVIPGSFKIYTTQNNVPFMQFDTHFDLGIGYDASESRFEIFPASLCAVRYAIPDTESHADVSES